MPKAEPSQSSLRDASSPEGGALFVLTGRSQEAPPLGGAGEQSESERVRFAGISPILSIDNRAKLAYITIVNTN